MEVLCLIIATLLQSWIWKHVLALGLPQLSIQRIIAKEMMTDIWSHSQFHNAKISTDTCMA